MLSKVSKQFSKQKSANFFWTEVNSRVQEAKYAVRGLVPTTAYQMKEDMEHNPSSNYIADIEYPFDEITFCNIGNPQEFHQKPITFNRQVVACMVNPELITMEGINPDAAKRAKGYLD